MRTSIALAASLLAASAHAQAPARACDSPQSHELDFWLGEWDLAYVQDGKPARSRNRITRILDGCAILEEFEGAPGVALAGRSVSMFDRRAARWKQVWVDNEGSWLDFEGGLENGRMVFSREAQPHGQRVRQRMVFDDVKRDSLTWRWQRSEDGGGHWKTLWEIAYRRAR